MAPSLKVAALLLVLLAAPGLQALRAAPLRSVSSRVVGDAGSTLERKKPSDEAEEEVRDLPEQAIVGCVYQSDGVWALRPGDEGDGECVQRQRQQL